MPDCARVEGVAFVEFATRGAETDALEAMLATLGFARAGSHVTKALALWTQGAIRIVVNRETAGHAIIAYRAHGSTVCNVGLAVPNAAATAARATAPGAEPFAAGEMDIPTIRGLGGSILHFVDEASGTADVWSVEFERGEAVAGGDAGLRRIDQLAQTMSYDEMLSWSLFYTTLFRMTKTPMVDVVDPDGLVRSQAVEADDGAFRITLNGAETHRTMAGNFLADSFGTTVQHIALARDNIFATVDALADRGFAPLPMSENYYADLAPRFDLASDMLARLRAGSILYDEDADGAFFQLYSRPTVGGLFLEIVERRGSYAG